MILDFFKSLTRIYRKGAENKLVKFSVESFVDES